ncbi:MAG: hypothetical protein L0Y66_09495 [Myxococcaceae bacterium]|nr:hypothetical protein [Myxococcaceae bacterium]MCI0672787.1 hypothetical protein [Myxococcaceae bacterium]
MSNPIPLRPSGPHVAMLGMMGSGKTTVGRALATRLGWPYLDNDVRFVERFGKTPAEVAALGGAEALHAREAELLLEALATRSAAVISVPGGAVLQPVLREALQSTFRVWLNASPETLARRITSTDLRPLLHGDIPTTLRALDAERRPHYAALAQLVLDVDAPGFTVEGAVERVVEALSTLEG